MDSPPQLFLFHGVKLVARPKTQVPAVRAALTPVKGDGKMKRASFRKAANRSARQVSPAGVIFIFLLGAAICAVPVLLAAADQKDNKAKSRASFKSGAR